MVTSHPLSTKSFTQKFNNKPDMKMKNIYITMKFSPFLDKQISLNLQHSLQDRTV